MNNATKVQFCCTFFKLWPHFFCRNVQKEFSLFKWNLQRWEKMLRFKVMYEGECGLFKGLKLGNIWQSSFLRLQPWQSIPHHLKYLLFLEILATLAIPYQLKYLTSIIIEWTLEINFSAKEEEKWTWNKSKKETSRSQWLNSFVFSKIFQCVCWMWLQIYILIDFGFILFDFGSTYWIFDFVFILFDFPTLFAALSSRLCVCASPGELSSTIITYHRDLFLIVFVLFVFVIFGFVFVLLIFSGFIFVHFFWARNAGYHHIYR